MPMKEDQAVSHTTNTFTLKNMVLPSSCMYLWQPRNMNKRHVDILQLAGRGVQLRLLGSLTSLSSAPPGTGDGSGGELVSRAKPAPQETPPNKHLDTSEALVSITD